MKSVLARLSSGGWAWFARRFRAQPPSPPPLARAEDYKPEPASNLNVQHREVMQQIEGDAWIFNDSDREKVLEGPIIKRLVISAKSAVRIASPVRQAIPDPLVPHALMMREWDALHVAEQMVEEYCRGCWYDEADPEDLKHVTLPFPKRSLARVAEKLGLRAQREGNSAQGR